VVVAREVPASKQNDYTSDERTSCTTCSGRREKLCVCKTWEAR